MAVIGPVVGYLVWSAVPDCAAMCRRFSVRDAGGFGDLFVTSVQLGVAFPDPAGATGSVVKFMGIFCSQTPVAMPKLRFINRHDDQVNQNGK